MIEFDGGKPKYEWRDWLKNRGSKQANTQQHIIFNCRIAFTLECPAIIIPELTQRSFFQCTTRSNYYNRPNAAIANRERPPNEMGREGLSGEEAQ